MPFAMRAMATAAVKAGLIDGSKTAQQREAALFKLMKQGKLIASELLPEFGKALSDLANNNNELSKALVNNMAPALGRASNNLIVLQEQLYKGMKPAVMSTINGFNDLSGESGNLAYFLGKVLGGAVLTVSALIRLPIAAFTDLTYAVTDFLDLGDETAEKFIGITGTIIGASIAVWGLVKAYKALKFAMKAIKVTKAAASELVGKGAKVATTATKNSGLAGTVGKGVIESGKSFLKGGGSSLLGKAGGVLAIGDAIYQLYDRLATTNDRNAEIVRLLKEREAKKDSVDINLNLNPNGLHGVIDAQVDKKQGDMIGEAYMNIMAGGER